MDIGYVVIAGVKYLRAEHVAEFIREIGATEPTDTRERLEIAADALTATPQRV